MVILAGSFVLGATGCVRGGGTARRPSTLDGRRGHGSHRGDVDHEPTMASGDERVLKVDFLSGVETPLSATGRSDLGSYRPPRSRASLSSRCADRPSRDGIDDECAACTQMCSHALSDAHMRFDQYPCGHSTCVIHIRPDRLPKPRATGSTPVGATISCKDLGAPCAGSHPVHTGPSPSDSCTLRLTTHKVLGSFAYRAVVLRPARPRTPIRPVAQR